MMPEDDNVRKRILLGICGGVAAYKAAELARLLVRAGFDVHAVLTSSAAEFITPLTMRAVTGNPVYASLFDPVHKSATAHIDLARDPDIAVIAPATANCLGKLAAGLADDLLSTVLLAIDLAQCPVILAPAMNTTMLCNPAVQDNIRRLEQRGYAILEPREGDLACQEVGKGRMVEPQEILDRVRQALQAGRELEGRVVLVTAGPTREALDPVRFFSNHSSGKMGFALARAARERGARVILVSGPSELAPPSGVEFCPVSSALEMNSVCMEKYAEAEIIIKAAAVADYRPELVQEQKIKKGGELLIKLVRNPDILQNMGRQKGERFLVGFAAETEQLLQNAARKLQEKNLDLVVANDLGQEGSGFAGETNRAVLLYRDGRKEQLPLMSKYELAHRILERIAWSLEGPERGAAESPAAAGDPGLAGGSEIDDHS